MDVEVEATGHANISKCPLPVGCMVRDALRAPKTLGVLPKANRVPLCHTGETEAAENRETRGPWPGWDPSWLIHPL